MMNVLFAIIDYDIITDLLPRNIYNSSNYSRKKMQKIIRTHLSFWGIRCVLRIGREDRI
jgi:hypothetical protein